MGLDARHLSGTSEAGRCAVRQPSGVSRNPNIGLDPRRLRRRDDCPVGLCRRGAVQGRRYAETVEGVQRRCNAVNCHFHAARRIVALQLSDVIS